MNLTKYQPHNQDEQAIIESRPNRIANIEAKDAFRNVLNVISSLFPLHGIDGDLTFYSTVTKEIVKTFGQIAANEIEIALEAVRSPVATTGFAFEALPATMVTAASVPPVLPPWTLPV